MFDEIIREKLRKEKIRAMKNPTIVMNPNDFDYFKELIEVKLSGLILGDNPEYEGIPIKTSDLMMKGQVMIIDEIIPHWR